MSFVKCTENSLGKYTETHQFLILESSINMFLEVVVWNCEFPCVMWNDRLALVLYYRIIVTSQVFSHSQINKLFTNVMTLKLTIMKQIANKS